MSLRKRISLAWKAARQLGLEQVCLYAAYRVRLEIEGSRRSSRKVSQREATSVPGHSVEIRPLFQAGEIQKSYREFYRAYSQQVTEIIREADEIAAGQVRLFGGPAVALRLISDAPLSYHKGEPANVQSAPAQVPLPHWSEYETGKVRLAGDPDLKLVWEPARFGWAFTLARAYLLSGKEDYAKRFWENTEAFLEGNPSGLGPNWMSGQEVALRLMALGFAYSAFCDSVNTTSERRERLAQALAEHAGRIPATMIYARAQNNNHLITEALGLYTAAALLPTHPQAPGWKALGWRWLNRALQKQIEPDGTYAQHSANYHRLMLQAALWGEWIARKQGDTLPFETVERLCAAAGWLLGQMDPVSGQFPNLGSNDGAYILPLAPGGFNDYRPTAQAAALAFLGKPALPPGTWDEMAEWLAQPKETEKEEIQIGPLGDYPGVIRGTDTWASLRAVRFHSRPAHADQLQVELWRKGTNIILDAGTYRYNAPAPWDNSLAGTLVHNSILVDGQDQMQRGGRFLWLDWAQASWLRREADLLEAEHDGYRRFGAIHRRKLEKISEDCWQIEDSLLSSGTSTRRHTAWVHWLLPDWPWSLEGTVLELKGPGENTRVTMTLMSGIGARITAVQLIRAGEILAGEGEAAPILGWTSPTYNVKIPALSFRVLVEGEASFSIQSEFNFQQPGPME